MPWAADNRVSTSPIEGGIEITDADYQAALAGMASGKIVSTEGGVFALVDPPPSPPPPEPPEPPSPSLPQYAAIRRLLVETGGTIWNGFPVQTDRESQSKIVAEVLAIERGERQDGDGWKFADGVFRPLTNAEMEALALAVRNHVRNAFAIEASVIAGIEAGSITTTEQIDAAFGMEVPGAA